MLKTFLKWTRKIVSLFENKKEVLRLRKAEKRAKLKNIIQDINQRIQREIFF